MAFPFRSACAVVVFVLLARSSLADDGEDTLRSYLSKSSLVVSGEIIAGPDVSTTEQWVNRYSMRVKVAKVIKGGINDKELKDGLDLTVIRFEKKVSERLAFLKKDGRVILFLRERDDNVRGWRSVDPWFGVQQYNEIMEDELERLFSE